MKEILVLCLTRYGDLIQTTPLLRGLRKTRPGVRITLAALKQFSAILPLIRGYDRTFLFDKDEAARRISRGSDPLAAYRHMDEFVRLLEQESYDLIVNLTCDRMSAYVVSALRGGSVSGITSAANGQRVISGRWGTHLFSVMQGENRKLNRINLVDISTKMGGANPDGQPVELHETEAGKLFADRFVAEEGVAGEKLIGIQLGASESVRCWPGESFARLSDLLQEQAGVRTVLFGSPGEKDLAERAMKNMRLAPINAVGKTGIEGLFSLVKRCSLLVTNDTGTMHFAAAGGTPVVMLSLGPAFFQCTGPYSEGNLALQPQLSCSPCRYNLDCHDPVCRTIVSVESVHNACRLLMGESVDLARAFPGVGVYRSRFGADGFLEWQELCNGDATQEELAQRYMRLWKGYIEEGTPSRPESHSLLSPELKALSARGMALTKRIMAAARQTPLPVGRIVSLGEQEASVEAQIKLLGSCSTAMAPLVDFLTLVRENITDADLYAIASQTHTLYEQGHRLATLL
jgi:ADP-heptose:LPS heptosyltransferase